MILSVLLSSGLSADRCSVLQSSFETEERAYDSVVRVAVAGNEAFEIIGKFVEEGEVFLRQCPKSYSLDRQYTLKRKLKKAKQLQPRYRVFSQSQLAQYARTHPEEIVVYKWGTIRPVP